MLTLNLFHTFSNVSIVDFEEVNVCWIRSNNSKHYSRVAQSKDKSRNKSNVVLWKRGIVLWYGLILKKHCIFCLGSFLDHVRRVVEVRALNLKFKSDKKPP